MYDVGISFWAVADLFHTLYSHDPGTVAACVLEEKKLSHLSAGYLATRAYPFTCIHPKRTFDPRLLDSDQFSVPVDAATSGHSVWAVAYSVSFSPSGFDQHFVSQYFVWRQQDLAVGTPYQNLTNCCLQILLLC